MSRCPCLFEALTDHSEPPNGPHEGAVRGEEVEVLQGVSLEAWRTVLEFIYAGTQPRSRISDPYILFTVPVWYANVWLGEQRYIGPLPANTESLKYLCVCMCGQAMPGCGRESCRSSRCVTS